MLERLWKENKIQEDFQRYKIAVGNIQNLNVKKQFESYLRDFENQINLIDEGHNTYNNGYIHPKRNRDNVERLIELRTKLETLF